MEETPYAQYLHLPELLTTQRPRTPAADEAQWADEHLFIVAHQSAEVLASQALVDLRRAARQARAPAGERAAAASVRRAEAVLTLLEGHLALLGEHLPADAFRAFRPLLGNASGSQSYQFARLFQLVDAPCCGVLSEAATAHGPEGAGAADAAGDGGRQELTAALSALRSAAIRWKTRHLLLVAEKIGDVPGTGGTSGLAFLRSRIALPPYEERDRPGCGGGRQAG